MNKEFFPEDLVVLNKADGSKYPFQLKENFIFKWKHGGILKGYESDTYEVKVPKGYTTDFGSLPRITQGIFNAVNDIAPAATVHDWCYSIELFERHVCDRIFYAALRANGIGWLRAQTLYRSVRLGGWVAWPHNSKEKIEDRELYRKEFGYNEKDMP